MVHIPNPENIQTTALDDPVTNLSRLQFINLLYPTINVSYKSTTMQHFPTKIPKSFIEALLITHLLLQKVSNPCAIL